MISSVVALTLSYMSLGQAVDQDIILHVDTVYDRIHASVHDGVTNTNLLQQPSQDQIAPPDIVNGSDVLPGRDWGSTASLPPPPSLIEPTDAMRTFAPPKYIDRSMVMNRAIPTNNWWGNIIAFDKGSAIQPVWSNPYALQLVADTAPFGLAVSYPYRSRVTGGSSGNGNASRYYAHGIVREFMFSAVEFNSRPSFQIVDWADLGVKVQIKSGTGVMESSMVSGMVYTTVQYTGDLSPKLNSIASIESVNGKTVQSLSGQGVTGSKFEIIYKNGQRWILYALSIDGKSESPLTLTIEAGSTLKSTRPFNGLLRVALANDVSWVSTLDKYKTCIVEGGSVGIESDTSYEFKWTTKGNCNDGLLHYAMIHHTRSIEASSATRVEGMSAFSTTRGLFQAYTTIPGAPLNWKLTEHQEIAEDFYPPRTIPANVVHEQRILDHLKSDIGSKWSIPLEGSYYFNGKAAQKYATLCLMAKDPAIVGSDTSLLSACLGKLRTVIAPFLSNTWTNKLQYDRVYGGIVSSEGFKKNDLNADFGNTMYNDHHFHYGYWINTAAMINLLDPTWSELGRLNAMAKLLATDVANSEENDQFFPRFRSFDWFRGHSYSHGVTPFADGKDQESTSEDINFSYGLSMLGKALKDSKMSMVGKLMTRVNARAIKTYFLVDDASQVHPASFKPNKVTGIFFDNKVDYATWFSAEKYCIHGIQMIPISPMTEFVRTKQFVQQEWDEVLSKQAIVKNVDKENTWLSLLYANYAAIDKSRALSVLQYVAMDDGLSRSWALYMAASMP